MVPEKIRVFRPDFCRKICLQVQTVGRRRIHLRADAVLEHLSQPKRRIRKTRIVPPEEFFLGLVVHHVVQVLRRLLAFPAAVPVAVQVPQLVDCLEQPVGRRIAELRERLLVLRFAPVAAPVVIDVPQRIRVLPVARQLPKSQPAVPRHRPVALVQPVAPVARVPLQPQRKNIVLPAQLLRVPPRLRQRLLIHHPEVLILLKRPQPRFLLRRRLLMALPHRLRTLPIKSIVHHTPLS